MKHVIPLNDDKPHTTNNCKCGPVIVNDVVVHNAYDNRELQEEKTGKSSKEKQWTIIEQ